MAKFAENDKKPYSPIDSKLLGTLAEIPPVEPLPEETPPAVSFSPSKAPSAAEKKDREQPKRQKPEPRAKSQPIPARRPQPEDERLNRVVKCLFTPSEDQDHRNLVNRLREKTGITLNSSHLMRPFFALLLLCEDELTKELVDAGLRRPINDKNALAAFERELAAIIHAALRRTKQEVPNKRA